MYRVNATNTQCFASRSQSLRAMTSWQWQKHCPGGDADATVSKPSHAIAGTVSRGAQQGFSEEVISKT